MTEDMKQTLTAIALTPIVLFVGLFFWLDYEADQQARKQEQAAAFRSMSPEQKLRQKVTGITELDHGENIVGIMTLQLFITQHFPSSYLWFLMTIEDTTRAAFSSYPDIQLLDVKINFFIHDTYGQPAEVAGLLYRISRETYRKIRWDTFNLENLPRIADKWSPLHHQLIQ